MYFGGHSVIRSMRAFRASPLSGRSLKRSGRRKAACSGLREDHVVSASGEYSDPLSCRCDDTGENYAFYRFQNARKREERRQKNKA